MIQVRHWWTAVATKWAVRSSALIVAVVVVGSIATRADAPPHDQYAPYKFLLGEWEIAPESGGPAVAMQRVRFGPNNAYLWYSGSLIMNGVEEPHFEGVLTWNGVHKNLDMLLTVDMKYGLASENGTVSIEKDGTAVREITGVFSEGIHPIGQPVVGPAGATGHFRQTFKPAGADKILSSVLRDSGNGWVATFPGSDHLVMTRRHQH